MSFRNIINNTKHVSKRMIKQIAETRESDKNVIRETLGKKPSNFTEKASQEKNNVIER